MADKLIRGFYQNGDYHKYGDRLYTTTGSNTDGSMTQKAVTELVAESTDVTFYPALAAAVDGTTGVISSSSSQSVWIAKVSAGDKLVINATNDISKAFRLGFYPTKPSIGDTLSNLYSKSTTIVKQEVVAPFDGYLCVSHGNTYFPDQNIAVMQDKVSGEENSLYYTEIQGKYIIYSSGNEQSLSSFRCTDYVDVEGLTSIIYPRRYNSSNTNSGMAFYDENKVYITGQRKIDSDTGTYVMTKIAVPANAKYARFTSVPAASGIFSVKGIEKTTVRPYVRYGMMRSNGEVGKTDNGVKSLVTPRFIKTNCAFTIRTSMTVLLRTYYYDKDYSFIERSAETITVNANTDTVVPIHNKAEFVKFTIAVGNSQDFAGYPDIQITGNFPVQWDVFNVRPLDSGYQPLPVRVNLTAPNCCDNETNAVQDAGDVGVDYGVLCLPETYSNVGKPTRLIIYCHGAGTQYDTDVSRFDSNALEPEYWLAEGYAVMDIEGNPFDNVNDHNQMPQSMDCYNAGYLWVLDHYNICRDGVLMGGRSMGGSCALNLIRRDCPIPVIACCSNVPGGLTMSNTTAVKKTFISEHYGFVTPSGFTWSNGVLTDTEKQVILNNWDKFVRNNPTLAMIMDLPQKESVMANYNYDLFAAFSANLHAALKCPVKFFCCNADTVAPPDKCAKMLYNMLVNGGQRTELRVFNSTLDGSSAHYYELRDPALRTTVVTKYGETMTNVPVVYVEMLRFWQRYEQEEL